MICLQLTATVMTLRRDPIQKFQGAAISGMLWVGLSPATDGARDRVQAAQRLGQRFQCGQVVSLEHVVHVAQRDLHAARERLESLVALQRVDPHQRVGLPGDRGQLAVQQDQVAALPAVGCDHDDGTAGEAAAAEHAVVGGQRLADAGAPAPVRQGHAGAGHGHVGIASGQVRGEAGKPGAEGEGLDVP